MKYIIEVDVVHNNEWIGDLYAGSLHIIPPFIWWATGYGIAAFLTFAFVTIMTPMATWQLIRRLT